MHRKSLVIPLLLLASAAAGPPPGRPRPAPAPATAAPRGGGCPHTPVGGPEEAR